MKNKKNFKCFFLNIVFVYNINMSVEKERYVQKTLMKPYLWGKFFV